jgi:hypothetical protein
MQFRTFLEGTFHYDNLYPDIRSVVDEMGIPPFAILDAFLFGGNWTVVVNSSWLNRERQNAMRSHPRFADMNVMPNGRMSIKLKA